MVESEGCQLTRRQPGVHRLGVVESEGYQLSRRQPGGHWLGVVESEGCQLTVENFKLTFVNLNMKTTKNDIY